MEASISKRFVGPAVGAMLVVLCSGLGAPALSAQSTRGKIEGTVRDQMGAPIAAAQVFLVGTTWATTTNSSGYYFLNNVLVGTVTLQAGFIGYQAARIEGIKILSGQTLTQDVTLEARPFEVEEITVIAAVNLLVPRDEVTTKRRISPFIRGGMPDEAVLYLDGLPTQSGSRNDLLDANATVHRCTSSLARCHGFNFGNLGLDPGVNTVSTVGFEAASIATGATATEFGNGQSGLSASQTRSGGPAWTGSLSYETDELFSTRSSFGFNRITGSISGPIAGGLTLFLGGDLEGRASTQPGLGRIDTPLLVQAGTDTTVHLASTVGDPTADTSVVDIQNWAVYTGECDTFSGSSNPDIANNYGYDCRGIRTPSSAQSSYRLNTILNWSYGTGSRLRASAVFNQFQERYLSLNGVLVLTNPLEAQGATGRNATYSLNWTQNLSRSSERALALEVGLSYQQDRFIRSALTRNSEASTYAPFGGFMIKPFDFVFDREAFPIDQALVEFVRTNRPGTRRSPYDLENSDQYLTRQRFRTNPYGLVSNPGTWSETGGPNSVLHRVNDEDRWVARATLDWQVDRFNRVKFGGEYIDYSITSYTSWRFGFPQGAYIQDPVRWNGFVQDRLDLGNIVVEGGLRIDYFNSKAERPYALDLDPQSETFNQYVFYPRTSGYQGFSGQGSGPADCADRPADPNDPLADPGGCPKTIFQADLGHSYLSPHIQVSFPVTSRTNFRLSYAHQAQTPDFSLLYAGLNSTSSAGADLDFGKTILFEVGMRHSFNSDAVLDVSVYNKDHISNVAARLVSLQDPLRNIPQDVVVMTNADFGNTKGIDIRYDRRFGNLFNGTLGYTFEASNNTGSDPFSYLNLDTFVVDELAGGRRPPPQAIFPTRQSRPHTLAGSFALNFPNDWKAGTPASWLENAGLFGTFRFASGTAFTRCPPAGNTAARSGGVCSGGIFAGDVNGARLPMLKEFDLRVTKGFGLGGMDVTGYLDIRNLFNFTNLHSVWAVTNDVNNKALVDQVFQSDLDQFRAEGLANGAWTLDGSMTLPGANQQCADWVDQGGAAASPNCIYLIRAEQRYGNGDRVFTMEEQRAVSQADYDRRFGLQELTRPGQHVRLGIEVNF